MGPKFQVSVYFIARAFLSVCLHYTVCSSISVRVISVAVSLLKCRLCFSSVYLSCRFPFSQLKIEKLILNAPHVAIYTILYIITYYLKNKWNKEFVFQLFSMFIQSSFWCWMRTLTEAPDLYLHNFSHCSTATQLLWVDTFIHCW